MISQSPTRKAPLLLRLNRIANGLKRCLSEYMCTFCDSNSQVLLNFRSSTAAATAKITGKLSRKDRALVRWLHRSGVDRSMISEEFGRGYKAIGLIVSNGYAEKDNLSKDWDEIDDQARQHYKLKFGVNIIISNLPFKISTNDLSRSGRKRSLQGHNVLNAPFRLP